MEIHHPEGPTHSFKDFAIHIGIVTLGILIALGLEGIRETVHEHRLLREARENFHVEMAADQYHMTRELANVASIVAMIDQLIIDLPALQKDPAQLKARVDAIQPSDYFLSTGSWTAALSSGALAHMGTEEVERYASFNMIVQAYVTLEGQTLPLHLDLESYVQSRKTFSPSELTEVEQRLRNFEMYEKIKLHVGRQCQESLQD